MRKEGIAFPVLEWSNEAGLEGKAMRSVRYGVLLLFTAVLMAGGLYFTQAQDKAAAPLAKPAPDPETVSVQVLTRLSPVDRQGLREYIPVLKRQTKDQWMTALPPEASPPISAAGTVQIDGSVHTDGRVTNLAITQSSGNKALDRAAWAAITGTTYDSFPYGLTVDQVKVRFTFVYNQGDAAAAPPAAPHP